MQDLLRVQTFFTALPLAFGVLHLFLYAALPRLRDNLYYGLFLLFIAATIFLDFQERLASTAAEALGLLRLQRACLAVSFIFALRFFYEVFRTGAPPHFRYLAAGLALAGAVAVVDPYDAFWPLQLLLIVGLAEIGRVMIGALRRRQEDARLIAGGVLTFTVFVAYDFLLDFGLLAPIAGIENAYQAGLVGLFGATSAFLARGIARTNRQLVEHERRVQEQEAERRVLAAEVERATAELEKARALQLSMLPEALPERPGLRIAVYTKTATEVGGDYYDAREEADGTLRRQRRRDRGQPATEPHRPQRRAVHDVRELRPPRHRGGAPAPAAALLARGGLRRGAGGSLARGA